MSDGLDAHSWDYKEDKRQGEPQLEHVCHSTLVLAALLGGRCDKMKNQSKFV